MSHRFAGLLEVHEDLRPSLTRHAEHGGVLLQTGWKQLVDIRALRRPGASAPPAALPQSLPGLGGRSAALSLPARPSSGTTLQSFSLKSHKYAGICSASYTQRGHMLGVNTSDVSLNEPDLVEV